MRKSILILAICTVLLVPEMSKANPPAAPAGAAAWQQLFAPDLANAIFPKGVWTVTDGVLTASEDQAIWTEKQYESFVLELEFKTEAGTNSGVIVYASNLEKWIPNSVEIQIADDFSPKWAEKPTSWQCAAIFGRQGPTRSAVKKPGQWNRMVVTCQGPIITVELNGQQVNQVDMRKWTSAKKNPDGSDIPPWLSKPMAELPTRGHIGLQGKHAGAPIWFRKLKIKKL